MALSESVGSQSLCKKAFAAMYVYEKVFLLSLQCDIKYGSLVLRSRVPSLSETSEREENEEEEEQEAFSVSRFSSNAVNQVCQT